MEGTIGEIRLFAGNFAPRTWAFCQGQILAISQNTALFSILGTTYGGNGQTTFGLPDLRGRVPVGTGTGPGLPNVVMGQAAGEPAHTLSITEIPAHNHTATSPAATASTTATPGTGVAVGPATLGAAVSKNFGTADGSLAAPSIGIAGGSQPHNNMQPYLGMNYIICLQGIFPARN
ncbi:MAG: tail fiber protein [Holophagaceae bacterium]